MSNPILVAVLEDHQGIIDGYMFRLGKEVDIKVVATAKFADELDALLSQHAVDVLLLDVNVPTSPQNSNPYPILFSLPRMLERFPRLNILVISMLTQPSLIKALMEAGASGYILKDDQETIRELASVVRLVAKGGIHLSRQANDVLRNRLPTGPLLAPRQQEALSLCATYPNLSTVELADKLGVAHSTLRNLLSGAYLRLNVRSRAAAIVEAQRQGLITPFSTQPNG